MDDKTRQMLINLEKDKVDIPLKAFMRMIDCNLDKFVSVYSNRHKFRFSSIGALLNKAELGSVLDFGEDIKTRSNSHTLYEVDYEDEIGKHVMIEYLLRFVRDEEFRDKNNISAVLEYSDGSIILGYSGIIKLGKTPYFQGFSTKHEELCNDQVFQEMNVSHKPTEYRGLTFGIPGPFRNLKRK